MRGAAPFSPPLPEGQIRPLYMASMLLYVVLPVRVDIGDVSPPLFGRGTGTPTSLPFFIYFFLFGPMRSAIHRNSFSFFV